MTDLADFPSLQKKPQFWFSTIQGMIGKLYVLSLYYIMYDTTFVTLGSEHRLTFSHAFFPLLTQK